MSTSILEVEPKHNAYFEAFRADEVSHAHGMLVFDATTEARSNS